MKHESHGMTLETKSTMRSSTACNASAEAMRLLISCRNSKAEAIAKTCHCRRGTGDAWNRLHLQSGWTNIGRFFIAFFFEQPPRILRGFIYQKTHFRV